MRKLNLILIVLALLCAVFCAVSCKKNNPDDTAEETESSVPTDEKLTVIFEYRDGAWGISVQNVWAVPMSEIKAVREDGGKIEVDVQYYADTLRLIPAQKVCVYITRTDNEFEYLLEKAVASDDTGCGIYYLSR